MALRQKTRSGERRVVLNSKRAPKGVNVPHAFTPILFYRENEIPVIYDYKLRVLKLIRIKTIGAN